MIALASCQLQQSYAPGESPTASDAVLLLALAPQLHSLDAYLARQARHVPKMNVVKHAQAADCPPCSIGAASAAVWWLATAVLMLCSAAERPHSGSKRECIADHSPCCCRCHCGLIVRLCLHKCAAAYANPFDKITQGLNSATSAVTGAVNKTTSAVGSVTNGEGIHTLCTHLTVQHHTKPPLHTRLATGVEACSRTCRQICAMLSVDLEWLLKQQRHLSPLPTCTPLTTTNRQYLPCIVCCSHHNRHQGCS